MRVIACMYIEIIQLIKSVKNRFCKMPAISSESRKATNLIQDLIYLIMSVEK